MGQLMTTTSTALFQDDGYRVMLMGMDASGKTTILYRLLNNEVVTTIPTVGFNVEKLYFPRLGGTIFTTWDLGLRDKMRPLARHYFPQTDALIYVVDIHDSERFHHAKDFLHWTIEDEHMRDVPILLLCNKQDKATAGSCTTDQIIHAMGLRYSNVQFRAFQCSALTGEGLHEGMEWLSQVLRARGPPRREQSQWLHRVLQQPPRPSNVGIATPKVFLNYDPTREGRNITLQRFAPIKCCTECPFAKSAVLWGGVTVQDNNGCSLEDQARANVDAFTVFAEQSRQGARLDGFCIELDHPLARDGEVKDFTLCVRRFLTALSDLDPAKEFLMRKKYIGCKGWRFRFAREDFFVTTFAPCYPITSSRFAFNTGRAFVLLQPETSFLRHDLPPDTEITNWDQPQTIRDRTRIAYRKAGRCYHTSPTDPVAHHIVRPLIDDGTTIVRWWE